VNRDTSRYRHVSPLDDRLGVALRHYGHRADHRRELPVVRHVAHRHRPRSARLRDREEETTASKGYDIALVTTDLTATPEEIITRYAARWSIEVTFFDVKNKNILGVGQARNRVPKAVERTSLLDCSVAASRLSGTRYMATTGPTQFSVVPRHPGTRQRPNHPPWTCSSSDVRSSPPDFCFPTPRPATTQEILEVQHAWALAAA
jgi:hypothetical protein